MLERSKKIRPEIKQPLPDINKYDKIILAFPIWWYTSPMPVWTFLESYPNWQGKKIYVFVTSGGSGIGKTAQKLEPFVKGGTIEDARRVTGVEELIGWK